MQRFDAAGPGHADVGQDDVDGRGFQRRDQFFPIGSFDGHAQVVEALQQSPQTSANKGLVIGESEADRCDVFRCCRHVPGTHAVT